MQSACRARPLLAIEEWIGTTAWLGRRAWVLAEGGARLGGTICSVDYRILPLAKIMIRLDGRRGTVLVQEMARGVSWDFADQAPGGSPGA